MKAIQFTQPKQLDLVEIDRPAPPGPGEARVRIDRVGICGTDIHGYLGNQAFFTYPRIPGHELGVTVTALGPGVTHLQLGDRCAVEPYLNCGSCYACVRGFGNCCERLSVLGVMQEGGLTEEMVLPAVKLHRANEISAEQCALVETLAIGCHACNRADIKEGQNVLIIGAGPIGLSVIEFVKLTGARIILLDRLESRLRFAQDNLGLENCIQGGDGTEVDQLAALTSSRLADVVIDATGNCASMSFAPNYCAHQGRVVFVGITQDPLQIPHAPLLHRRELDIRASRNALPEDFSRIIQLIMAGSINTTPWITHRLAFGDVLSDFDRITRPESQVVKAVIDLSALHA